MSQSHPPPQPGETHALSCVSCRQRKVKCAKVYPCPHCVRGGLECIFPARKKDRAPRRNKNVELLSRLAKLEAIVVGRNQQTAPSNRAAVPQPLPAAPQESCLQAEIGSGRMPQNVIAGPSLSSPDNPAAKYVSGDFWTNLATEVEGIKTVLEQPSGSEEDSEDDDGSGGAGATMSPESGGQASHHSPASHMVSPAMLGNTQLANGMVPPRHPSSERIKKLRDIYFRNVDMLIKILHRPTIEKEFDLFIVNPHDNLPSKSIEALFFAVYFAAITSLSPEICKVQLGEDRAVLVLQYRQALEVALSRADYLNNTSLECLQALTLYDAILRIHTKNRESWALFALVYRISLAHNIHHDGAGTAFPPYEAEQRRRLWAQIIVLDVRAAQDRGTEPMIRNDDFTTLPPTNLDDADFGPGSTAPLVAREGPSDVTFSRCTYACSCLFLHIHGAKNSGAAGGEDAAMQETGNEEEDVIMRIKDLETQFIAPALDHPTHFGSAMGAAVVRITTLIFWLTIQYPFRVRAPTTKPRVSRGHMLQTAVAIMELQAFGPSGVTAVEYESRFAWWKDGYVQWHALAVALAELCVQTDGALVERAWATVEKVLPVWREKVADSRRGPLWRPIRKLLRKARERRAEARLRRLRIEGGAAEVPSGVGATARNVEMAFSPAASQDSWAPSPAEAQGQRRTAAAGLTPFQAATEVGPTGIPFNTSFEDDAMVAAAAPLAPPSILHNAHQWTIDYSDLDMIDVSSTLARGPADVAAVDVPQQELDMLDWSAWNDFVQDANVNLEDATTPSSEGQEASMGSGSGSGSGWTSTVITERKMPVGTL